MKQLLCILIAFAFVATAQARQVKVTIDGTVSPSQTTLYLRLEQGTGAGGCLARGYACRAETGVQTADECQQDQLHLCMAVVLFSGIVGW